MNYASALLSLILVAGSFAGFAEEVPGAAELLERSIAYHDPEGVWMSAVHRLELTETRPGGAQRSTTITIDNRNGSFQMARVTEKGTSIEIRVRGDSVEAKLNGSPRYSEEEAKNHRLIPEAARRTRNYYTYLYGLPMKLRDPGTRLDPVAKKDSFQGKEVYSLKVTYEEPVGQDTWYFYLDPETAALIGYRFYHDESKNDGEYITLEGLAKHGGLLLPKTRAWHVNEDSKHLGTDTIESLHVRR